jgi:glycosyltransferase involved in cell wall biosynthesis
MKVLVSLPTNHKNFSSIDDVLSGKAACSGTDGSFIRLASFLSEAGFDVSLSAACKIPSTQFLCILHAQVKANQFDHLVVHQSHWNGTSLTFGNQVISKVSLWLHNQIIQPLVYTFLKEGGSRIVCPTFYHAGVYRALPHWRQRVAVVYNSYCPVFQPVIAPPNNSSSKPRLLFVGAIAEYKGFLELMQIWSYLAKKRANLELAIAGSIVLHSSGGNVGAMGLAKADFESSYIRPWLESLPEEYQPNFLGALSPDKLKIELAKSWAVIVNPSFRVPETFCVAAVEAQSCDRTVFSVACGALKETVYRGRFDPLVASTSTEDLGERILEGLSNPALISEHGRLAGKFAREKFGPQVIQHSWVDLLTNKKNPPYLPVTWGSPRDLVCDLMRWSNTAMLVGRYRNAEYGQVLAAYRNSK